jgi:hypothetical protein
VCPHSRLKDGKTGEPKVAYYKYPQFLRQWDHAEFDEIRGPGTTTGWSGIYRCEGCGKEVVSTAGHPLPPQNHHQHTPVQGYIRWRLVVTDMP